MKPSHEPQTARIRGASRELALVVSGASGMSLASRFAEFILEHVELDALHLVVTQGASAVLSHEMGGAWASARGFRTQLEVTDDQRTRIKPWSNTNLGAPIASGSYALAATVVLPCSAGMTGAIAHGISKGLAQRAADVALKERRPLVLGIRETPMSPILLENMLKLARAGAHIVPPLPAFYLKPDEATAMSRYIDHYCMRILDLVGIHIEGRDLRWRG